MHLLWRNLKFENNMSKTICYGEYLQLDKILSAQAPESANYGEGAHDEMLFIVIHQAYELWFKQILHELQSVCHCMNAPVLSDHTISLVVHRLGRITAIQKLLVDQLAILKTLTPMEFLEFRDYLIPASGFQSVQFRQIEMLFGLSSDHNNKQAPYFDKLASAHQQQPLSLFDLVETWLTRMPFLQTGEFNFWLEYQKAVQCWLGEKQQQAEHALTPNQSIRQKQIKVEAAHFATLFDKEKYYSTHQNGKKILSYEALGAALFIYLYREQPVFQLPFQLLSTLVSIDELFTQWRYGHALLVMRMIGTKVGTGGSAGHEYLKSTVENHKIFNDIANLTTYIIPRNALPKLVDSYVAKLGFVYNRE